MPSKFSVVLPTKDRPERLEKLSAVLDSLAKQESPPEHELVLVDENPGTGVKDLAESSGISGSITYIPLPDAGVVGATNEAVNRADGDIILFMGDDTTADKRLMAEHAKSQRGLNAAVLGWTKWHPNVKDSTLKEFARCIGPQLDPHYLPLDKTNLPFYFFMTANLSVTKQALLDAGLFDAGFAYPSYEDCELGYRLTKNGVRIAFNELAVAYHDHEISLQQLCDRQRKIGHGMVVFTQKHPEEKTIAAKVAGCRKQPFGVKTARLLEGVAGRLEGRGPAPLLKLNYMLLYSTYLAIGVREELAGREYRPTEDAY